jgi:hypothetical protein
MESNAAAEASTPKNSKSSLKPNTSKKREIPIYRRRKTAHDQNVEAIKA